MGSGKVAQDSFSLEASKFRSLKLKISSSYISSVLEFLKNATNLKMLHLEFLHEGGSDFYLEAGYEYNFGASTLVSRLCQLRYLFIEGIRSGADFNFQLMVTVAFFIVERLHMYIEMTLLQSFL